MMKYNPPKVMMLLAIGNDHFFSVGLQSFNVVVNKIIVKMINGTLIEKI